MFIEIQPNSDTSIYIQLMYQIKKGIVKKEWTFGESLPSVRSLAGDLGINMHTVNKAYNLLVDEGVLEKNQKGYFVREQSDVVSNDKMRAVLQEKLKEIIIDRKIYAISDEIFTEWLDAIEKDFKREEE